MCFLPPFAFAWEYLDFLFTLWPPALKHASIVFRHCSTRLRDGFAPRSRCVMRRSSRRKRHVGRLDMMGRWRRIVVDKIVQCSRRVGSGGTKGRRTAWLISRGGQVGHVVDVGFGVDVLVHIMVVVGVVGIVIVMLTDGGVGAVDGESAVFVRDAHCERMSARRVSRGFVK